MSHQKSGNSSSSSSASYKSIYVSATYCWPNITLQHLLKVGVIHSDCLCCDCHGFDSFFTFHLKLLIARGMRKNRFHVSCLFALFFSVLHANAFAHKLTSEVLVRATVNISKPTVYRLIYSRVSYRSARAQVEIALNESQ